MPLPPIVGRMAGSRTVVGRPASPQRRCLGGRRRLRSSQDPPARLPRGSRRPRTPATAAQRLSVGGTLPPQLERYHDTGGGQPALGNLGWHWWRLGSAAQAGCGGTRPPAAALTWQGFWGAADSSACLASRTTGRATGPPGRATTPPPARTPSGLGPGTCGAPSVADSVSAATGVV